MKEKTVKVARKIGRQRPKAELRRSLLAGHKGCSLAMTELVSGEQRSRFA